MEQSSTPIHAVQAWLAAQTPGAVLDGVPVGVLLEHFLQAQAQGLPSAGHELQVLEVLVDHWLKRMQADIESFPPAAVAVLDEQKKQILGMHQALSDLQNCLQLLRLSQFKQFKLSGLAARASERPKSWQSMQPQPQPHAQRRNKAIVQPV
ncbi:hypothetical protein LNV09_07310 [Paucibacter sp. B2R-40]|uniref:hypothetical protein n=1 Tax=Paucibacter sp. B2R-40 TaxID=2893554 RepID=UPI0021E3B6B9|nr:hypothetical protein [Paucibacter sp. B2R-40]MCV2353973.1 hypothetical protein [Paucibacter sp. B2R-40]